MPFLGRSFGPSRQRSPRSVALFEFIQGVLSPGAGKKVADITGGSGPPLVSQPAPTQGLVASPLAQAGSAPLPLSKPSSGIRAVGIDPEKQKSGIRSIRL